MIRLYNALALPALRGAAHVGARFNDKMRRALEGRKDLGLSVKRHYSVVDPRRIRILVHIASFGELEQAKPVIEALRIQYPDSHIHLTFFSPSGYEHAVGKYTTPDFITYSPDDSPAKVREFLDASKPDLVLFTRYDVWPNFAMELGRRAIKSVLFCATGGESSGRFHPLVDALHREVYRNLTHTCTISEEDRLAFVKLGVDPTRITPAGDTRFDQVRRRSDDLLHRGNTVLPAAILSRIAERQTFVFVAGSIWPKDVAVIRKTVQASIARHDNILFILVPHEPDEAHVRELISIAKDDSIRLSRIADYHRESLIVVDSIGQLFGLYQYADVAYVGGGFGAGIHNLLEAAIWGKPVIFGPKHQRSREAGELIAAGAGFEIANDREFDFVFWRMAKDRDLCTKSGERARTYVQSGGGATEEILRVVRAVIPTRD